MDQDKFRTAAEQWIASFDAQAHDDRSAFRDGELGDATGVGRLHDLDARPRHELAGGYGHDVDATEHEP